MLAFTSAALVGALAVSALDHHLVTRSVLSVRQSTTPFDVPDACSSTCTSALQIYSACSSGDTTTCLSVCQQSTFNNFLSCLDCLVENTPGFGSSEASQLGSAVSQLQQACAAASQTVTGSVTATGATVSGSASASGSSNAVTSAASTTGGASSSATGAASSASQAATSVISSVASQVSGASSSAASATSRASSAASSAASTPTGAAAPVVKAANVLAGAAGLVGAAMLF